MPETSVYDAAAEQQPAAAEVAEAPTKIKPARSKTRQAAAPAARQASAERRTVRPSAREFEPDGRVPVGTEVAYRIRLYGEWVPAIVIDEIPAPNKQGFALALDAPDDGCLHLAVKLNPKRHNSSGSVGYRQNVPFGDKVGNWHYAVPDDNADRVKAAQTREQEMINVRRQIMRGDTMSVTDEALT